MRKPNDVTLKQAIEKMLSVYKLKGKYDETGIVNLWPEVMGTAVANRTQQIYVHQKKLFVRVESSVIKNDLLIIRDAIIQKLNDKVGAKVIQEIVFL
ncbi:MAG: DUF721 domain-containing protein [Sphingobacteriaceae bacterium]|nr:DUF721 domain-containing protein [Sphingobacteriaceae bacterium]